MKTWKSNPHTKSEPISVTLSNSEIVTGTFWFHPSQMGSFEIEYNGSKKSDGRCDYTDIAHMRSIARIMLSEMAESR